MKTTGTARRALQSLPALTLIALAALLPAVIASGGEPGSLQEQPGGAKLPLAVYPGNENLNQTLGGSVVLPSRRFGLPADIASAGFTLEPVESNQLQSTEPNQIGINRPVYLSSRNLGMSFANPDGSRLRVIRITSPGARGLRVRLEGFGLLPGDQVFVYGAGPNSHVAGPYSENGPFGDGAFWAGIVDGDTAIIEHYIRTRERSFNIPEISHIYGEVDTVSPQVLGCEEDASCGNEAEKNAVGRIVFGRGTGTFVCTGTMLNNRTGDFTPLFLTAAHCVSSEEVARTVQTYWFYQSTACNSGVLRSDIATSSTGATLLATSRASDQTLLQVQGTIPAGVVFAGWDSTSRSAGTVYGLHHPGGGVPPISSSLLRRAVGQITGFLACPPSGLVGGYETTWTTGVTEPGSSGSGLFAAGSGLIGVLSCGPSTPSCADRLGLYGKFSDFYPLVQIYLDQGAGASCVTSVSPTQQSFTRDGGAGNLNVFAPTGCLWTAQSNVSWINISGPSGSGTGGVTYAVQPNTEASVRSGLVTVQNKTLTITQAGIDCFFTLSPTTQSFAPSGGAGSLTVSADSACAWTAVSNADWIALAQATSGTGSGAVAYSVTANLTPATRAGRITVGDKSLEVTQTAGPVITGAVIEGKQLIVAGANFLDGAELLVDGVKQKKTGNDPASIATRIVARKTGRWIAPGQTVTLQVRNPDGSLSQEFRFTRPASTVS